MWSFHFNNKSSGSINGIFLVLAFTFVLAISHTLAVDVTATLKSQSQTHNIVGHDDNGAPIQIGSPSSPWCSTIKLSSVFSDDMLLQRDARAAIYGVVQPLASESLKSGMSASHAVRVEVLKDGQLIQSSTTTLVRGSSNTGQEWKVLLESQPAGTGFTIVASCVHVSTNHESALIVAVPQVAIERVAFGDLFFCFGQSNMALWLKSTFASARTLETLRKTPVAQRDRLRLMRYGGMNEQYISTTPIYVDLQNRRSWFNITQALVQPDYMMSASSTQQHQPDQFKSDSNKDNFDQESKFFITEFSAPCLYFGLALLEKLGPGSPPLGLVQSSMGGTMIEQWLDVAETAKCSDVAPLKPSLIPGGLFNGMTAPLVNMTTRGWMYYQGENNVFATTGNSATDSGYGCEMPTLVASWRKLWSVEPNTTSNTAVFGIVTLASMTDEGHPFKMGGFRWSQTANYGVAPNPKMPNVFVAQAYDLGDPWPVMDKCSKLKCCLPHHPNTDSPFFPARTNSLRNNNNIRPFIQQDEDQCMESIESWETEDWYMMADVRPLFGPIHPRLKEPVGRRLAIGVMGLSYGSTAEPFTGPTIKRCGLRTEKHRNVLDIVFDLDLLMGDTIEFTRDDRLYQGYEGSEVGLDNVGLCFGPEEVCGCMEWEPVYDSHGKNIRWDCVLHALPEFENTNKNNVKSNDTVNEIGADVFLNGNMSREGFHDAFKYRPDGNKLVLDHWVIGVVKPGDVGAVTITVDLNASINDRFLSGGSSMDISDLRAVKYAWGLDTWEDSCCRTPLLLEGLAPCPPNSCPLRTRGNKLPGNPFFAMINEAGQCKCTHPQVCHE